MAGSLAIAGVSVLEGTGVLVTLYLISRSEQNEKKKQANKPDSGSEFLYGFKSRRNHVQWSQWPQQKLPRESRD